MSLDVRAHSAYTTMGACVKGLQGSTIGCQQADGMHVHTQVCALACMPNTNVLGPAAAAVVGAQGAVLQPSPTNQLSIAHRFCSSDSVLA